VTRRRRRGAAGVAVVALVVLGACGSGGDRSAKRSPTTRPTTTRPTLTTTGGGDSLPNSAAWATYGGDDVRTGLAVDGPRDGATAAHRWSSPQLDGDIYAQPLVVGSLVVVATERDTVYALHASDGTVAWQRNLGTPVPGANLPCGNIDPVGITGTPVVDPVAQRVYAVAFVQPGRHLLFALDLHDGSVVGSAPVDPPGSEPVVQNQRGALTLHDGRVFVPFGGRNGDCGSYHGRVTAVDVSSGAPGRVTSYTLPTQREGGFWAPPGASLLPDGSLLLTSGNSSSQSTYDYGNSVVRLTPSLALADSFAPSNWESLNATDTDLGSTGPVVLPDERVFQVGKSGVGYLLSATKLGGVGGELTSTRVCPTSAFGTVAHDGTSMFVPCLDGVRRVSAAGDRLAVTWTAALDTPGPPLLTRDAVWTVATGNGTLVALARDTGKVLRSTRLGSVPSRFTAPGAGDGLVVVGADRTILAYG
jgi:outer membrane protein assembly factor BamB